MKLRLAGIVFATAVVASFATPRVALSQTTGDFFAGKTISIFVGYTAGSGYDVYARLLARHYARHIPGQPRVIVQNMPGGGSLTALNHVAQVAPRDGTALGAINRSLPLARLLETSEADAIRYEPFTLNYIGSMSEELAIGFVAAKTGVKTFDDLRRREVTTGTAAVASDGFVFPNILNSLFGTKIKVILGYTGTDKVFLAMENGELDGYLGGTLGSLLAGRPTWIRDGYVNVLLQYGVERSPRLPDVPAVGEWANAEQRDALALVFAPQRMGRPIVAPPNVPADRIVTLQKAFDATMLDPALVAEAGKMQAEITPMTGPEIKAFIHKLHQTPEAALKVARQALRAPAQDKK